jgi:hypothetical protein
VDPEKLYNYLLDQAKNNPVEVAAYELKRGTEKTRYFVLPWNRNTKSSSVLPISTIGKYIPGYSIKDVTGVFHTHPRSTPPGIADRVEAGFAPIYGGRCVLIRPSSDQQFLANDEMLHGVDKDTLAINFPQESKADNVLKKRALEMLREKNKKDSLEHHKQ